MNKPGLQYLKTSTPVAPFFIIFARPEPGEEGRELVLASGFGSLQQVRALLLADYYDTSLAAAKAAHPYQDLVQEYFSGNPKVLRNIPIDSIGTVFQSQVWRHLRAIPYGKTISYTALAKLIGMPKAVRAVGSACKANRHILLTPCHRVIKSDGTLGEYRFGREIKQRLLKLEENQ